MCEWRHIEHGCEHEYHIRAKPCSLRTSKFISCSPEVVGDPEKHRDDCPTCQEAQYGQEVENAARAKLEGRGECGGSSKAYVRGK